jgi:lactoylglutathione lyase
MTSPRSSWSRPATSIWTSAFLNIRVADLQAAYRGWRFKGAVFLTPPKDHGREIRCYMRDPDDHVIEVGHTTGALRDR